VNPIEEAGNSQVHGPTGQVSARQATPEAASAAREFYLRYKDWFDEQNRRFEERGLWNDDLRPW
jgi:hypothetical protein